MDWTHGKVAANGIELAYYRTGGNKPPVVLAHGITDNGLCWTHVAQRLEADYDVIMYDARGHGQSSRPTSGYGYETLATDLAGLLDALHIEGPVLMGHSMGAATVAAFAALSPQRTRGIVVEDPPWRHGAPPPAEEQEARVIAFRQGIIERRKLSREALVELCHRQSPSWPAVECGPWAESKLQVSEYVAERMRATPEPWEETVRRIQAPILLVTADPERGAIVTPQTAREAEGLWRQGRAVHIPGAGHSIHREQFEAVMAAVVPFIRECFQA